MRFAVLVFVVAGCSSPVPADLLVGSFELTYEGTHVPFATVVAGEGQLRLQNAFAAADVISLERDDGDYAIVGAWSLRPAPPGACARTTSIEVERIHLVVARDRESLEGRVYGLASPLDASDVVGDEETVVRAFSGRRDVTPPVTYVDGLDVTSHRYDFLGVDDLVTVRFSEDLEADPEMTLGGETLAIERIDDRPNAFAARATRPYEWSTSLRVTARDLAGNEGVLEISTPPEPPLFTALEEDQVVLDGGASVEDGVLRLAGQGGRAWLRLAVPDGEHVLRLEGSSGVRARLLSGETFETAEGEDEPTREATVTGPSEVVLMLETRITSTCPGAGDYGGGDARITGITLE